VEVDAAARRRLLTDQTIGGYVDGKIYTQRLGCDLNGTGGYAIVVVRNGGWASPNQHNDGRFPLLLTKCYADPDRDEDGSVKTANGQTKALALDKALDRLLHRALGQTWGAVGSNPGRLIISCYRASEPVAAGQGDALAGGEPLGDVVLARSLWQIETIR
jgi:hypothetical protein